MHLTTSTAVFTVLLLLCLAGCQAQAPVARFYNGPVTSSSSVYDSYQSRGGCGYNDDVPRDFGSEIYRSVAIERANYFDGAVCGMCIRVTNVTEQTGNAIPFPSPPFTVIVNNLANDDLSPYWLDFSMPAVGGNWGLTWQAVDCPVNDIGIKWQVWSDSSWYFQVIPLYARIAVHTMCVWTVRNGQTNASWVPLERENGNFVFLADRGYAPVEVPRVKAISVDGQVIEDTINIDLSQRHPAYEVIEGMRPGNFRPLSGRIMSNPPDCNGDVTNDDPYGGGGSSASRVVPMFASRP